MTSNSASHDVAIVGAGTCGLAEARMAARRGRRGAALDRDARCFGASIRNFAFLAVTGASPSFGIADLFG